MPNPYSIKNGKIHYNGNRIYEPVDDISVLKPKISILSHQWENVIKSKKEIIAVMNAFNLIHELTTEFMKKHNSLLFNLPIITRMISSPGAVTKTIMEDVRPFKVNFFGKEGYLTQSSQLYLEFAVMSHAINCVYCWDKSFRNEETDFRHLPEFTHVEFEGKMNLEGIIDFQEEFICNLIDGFLTNEYNILDVFLKQFVSEGCFP